MAHDRALQMRIRVVLAGLVMTIVEAGRRQLLEPDLKVLDETFLPVVHVHACRDVHGRNERHPFLHGAPADDRRDFVRDPDEFTPLFRVEREIVGEDLHSANAASALRSGGASAPTASFRNPAAAIIAALSVDSGRLGTNVGTSRRAPRSSSSARRRLFAETPPA